ncbi:hypothetical protein C5C56_06150 [Rathayibacter sp. AY1D1]|uniref:hypothetical protein n=1 Tax=unclassified Rathayibacter TaxID=2609250 RepID=UPI000CE8F60B|nr:MULTISPECIES: hypothetical protein [unclassified Rathayibacter]PPG84232.1 hypothetical protein C5C52_01460 [Rathayibacter sp. AY1E5]PPI00618.1 hypothetical protein C5C56_06150 [Rathayibacter sp. AY1D1]
MATISSTPLVMKNATFKVGADNYEAAISSVVFTPSADTVTWQGLTPASSYRNQSSATWECAITFLQDYSNSASLSRYLFNNEGLTVNVEFVPAAGTGATKITASVILLPGQIGGNVNAIQEATVTLGVSGKPQIV